MKEKPKSNNKLKKLIYLMIRPLNLQRKDSIIHKIGKQPVALIRTVMPRTMQKLK